MNSAEIVAARIGRLHQRKRQRKHQHLLPKLRRLHLLRGSLDSACEHRELIRRFGRFPHRNAVLGRVSSAAESAYLEAGGKRFGQ